MKICDRVFDRVFNWLDEQPGAWSAYAMITLVVLAIPFALVEGLIRLGWRAVRKAVRKMRPERKTLTKSQKHIR